MYRQIARDLDDWDPSTNANRAFEVAEERHIHHRGNEIIDETGDGQRYRATLAPAAYCDQVRVYFGQSARRLHRADSVREDAAIVVGVTVLYSAGGKPG